MGRLGRRPPRALSFAAMSVPARFRGLIGKYRIQKLADRDLDAFEAEHRSLIRACDEAERAFEFAPADEAAARLAAYLELVALGRDRLDQVRDERLSDLGDGSEAER